jgi:Uma2 family endonuclease
MSETATLPPDLDAPPPGAGELYEVINGRVVEPPEMGVFESVFATVLSEAIGVFFANSGRLGRTAVETLFRIRTDPDLQRRPDLAFVSYDRWPRDRPIPKTAAWEVVPDLAVEVVSPNDLAVEVLERLDDYFAAGVRQVWVVYPRHQRFFVHDGPKRVTILDASDMLDGGEILPGFRLRLAELFEGMAGAGPA